MQLAQDSLRRLGQLAPVVIIAGNHDSAPLFDFFAALLGEQSRLHFVGQPRLPKKGGVLEFPGDSGEVARLAMLPFVHAHRVIEALETPAALRTMAYADRVMKLQEAYAQTLRHGFQARRHINLFVAHLFVDGSAWSRSERPLHVSETYATRVSSIPPVAYAAFGHIHKPQALPGGIPGRYAGSPIALDFGEVGEEKQSVFVEVKPGQAAQIRTLPLHAGRPLFHLQGDRAQIEAEAPNIGEGLLKITVDTDKIEPGLAEWASALFPRATLLEVGERLRNRVRPSAKAAEKVEVEKELDLLFGDYLKDNPHPRCAEGELRQTFMELWRREASESAATPPAEEGLHLLLQELTGCP
jgi:exonuclease SbcD